MAQRARWIMLGILLAGLAAGFIYLRVLTRRAKSESPQAGEESARSALRAAALQTTGPNKTITLYFPSDDEGVLLPEARQIAWASDDTDHIHQVLLALIEGSYRGLRRPLPAATEIRASSTQVENLPLQIVPRVTISLEPREMLVPPSRRGQTLEEVARVHYYGSAPAQIEVGLANTPPGWPIISSVALKFEGPGDQLARLKIVVPRDASAATLSLRANAKLDGQQLAESVEPLPTLPSWLWTEPAAVTLCVPDLIVPEHLRVGYVAAENDPIPEILREAGVSVDLLDPIALAFNDLSGYDAIAVGIRAYELRSDLASSNHRLLEYAAAGGTLVVQYQRSVDWNRILPAPYPAKVGVPTLRITDRNSPVRVLAPQSPLLNFPNKIAAGDFEGWVQERGLYFLGDLDSRYTAILALRDPGEQDLTGGLVAAPVGKGTYIYTGLSFFRQLPAGVQGPLRLFVNLVSQSRGPKSS